MENYPETREFHAEQQRLAGIANMTVPEWQNWIAKQKYAPVNQVQGAFDITDMPRVWPLITRIHTRAHPAAGHIGYHNRKQFWRPNEHTPWRLLKHPQQEHTEMTFEHPDLWASLDELARLKAANPAAQVQLINMEDEIEMWKQAHDDPLDWESLTMQMFKDLTQLRMWLDTDYDEYGGEQTFEDISKNPAQIYDWAEENEVLNPMRPMEEDEDENMWLDDQLQAFMLMRVSTNKLFRPDYEHFPAENVHQSWVVKAFQSQVSEIAWSPFKRQVYRHFMAPYVLEERLRQPYTNETLNIRTAPPELFWPGKPMEEPESMLPPRKRTYPADNDRRMQDMLIWGGDLRRFI